MVGVNSTIALKAVATDKVRAAIHDIRQLNGLDVPKEPLPGSTPDKPLHVSAVHGEIDWDNLPEDIAEEFLALNARIVALQSGSGGRGPTHHHNTKRWVTFRTSQCVAFGLTNTAV